MEGEDHNQRLFELYAWAIDQEKKYQKHCSNTKISNKTGIYKVATIAKQSEESLEKLNSNKPRQPKKGRPGKSYSLSSRGSEINDGDVHNNKITPQMRQRKLSVDKALEMEREQKEVELKLYANTNNHDQIKRKLSVDQMTKVKSEKKTRTSKDKLNGESITEKDNIITWRFRRQRRSEK